MANWIEEVERALAKHRLRDFVVQTLECFGSPFPRSGETAKPPAEVRSSLEEFSEEFADTFDELAEGAWQSEVDPAIAKLFMRRLMAVDALLKNLSDGEAARWLALGLRVRMREIMRAGVWPAIRLRALADFYYSRAVLLAHGIDALDLAALRKAASGTTWQVADRTSGAPTLWQSHYEDDGAWGPQHIRALKIGLAHYRLATFDLRHEADTRESLAERLESVGAIAGSSGGFFLYSEPDIEPPSAQYDPVGMLLSEGRISSPPIENRAALLTRDGAAELRRVGLADVELHYRGVRIDLRGATHRSVADCGPDALSISLIGDRIHEVGTSLQVPLSGVVIPWDEDYGAPPKPGDKVQWSGPQMASGAPAEEGISGGPLLLAEGEPIIDYRAEGFWGKAAPLTFSQDETGDRNLLARLVVGLDASGYLYIVAVDGRQADRALGLSLAGCAAWMQGLGCTRAANMDGGSSKRLMLRGQVLDAPTTEVSHKKSTETKTRPVYSGLAVIPKKS